MFGSDAPTVSLHREAELRFGQRGSLVAHVTQCNANRSGRWQGIALRQAALAVAYFGGPDYVSDCVNW